MLAVVGVALASGAEAGWPLNGSRKMTRFRIERALKGQALGTVLDAAHSTQGAACGLSFTPGKRYLLTCRVGPRPGVRLRTNLCRVRRVASREPPADRKRHMPSPP